MGTNSGTRRRKRKFPLLFVNCDRGRIEIDHLYGLRCHGWYCNPEQHSLCRPVNSYNELDESTARRQLKSPRSLSGRSIHLTSVSRWSRSWSWMTYCHTLFAMSIGPFHSEIQLYQNLTMKIHGQGHVCGQRSRSRLIFKFKRSRLWSRSNPLVTFEAWSSIDMFAFSFVAIGPLLAEI